MIHSITVLAQLPSGTDSGPGVFGVVVVGFLFVIFVLALLAAVTSVMGAWFSKQAANRAEQAAEAAKSASGAASGTASIQAPTSGASAGPGGDEPDADDPELMAVIAAAVHTMVGDRPHRVVSIRSAGPGWAQEGRRQIFSSHRVR